MTTFVFANNVDTTLASSVSPSATTITVTDGANLPTLAVGQTFVVTLNDAATQQVFEVMYATAISGTTLTVSRAQEGTTAQAWAAGDYAFSGPTAGQMRAFYQGQSVGQGTVTSVGMSMPSGFSVSGSPVTTAGTMGVTFASQSAGLFLATAVTGGAVSPASWRSMAAADVNGALGYTAANDASVVHLAGAEVIAGPKAFTEYQVFNGAAPAASVSYGGLCIASNISGSLGEADFISANGGANGYGFNFYSRGATGALTLLGSLTADGFLTTFDVGCGALSATTGTFSGALTCTTMNASSSDRRLKRDIKLFEPRPIHRAVPLVSYTLKENGWHGLGSVAQRMQKVAPEHVGEFDWHGKKRLSLDYGRAAYEEAMWAGLALDKALDRIKVLEKRLAALERRI